MASAAGVAATEPKFFAVAKNKKVSMASAAGVAATTQQVRRRTQRSVSMASAAGVAATQFIRED